MLVVVTLLGTFSITANAESKIDYNIHLGVYYKDYDTLYEETLGFLPNGEMSTSFNVGYIGSDTSLLELTYNITPKKNEIISSDDRTVTVTLSNIHLLCYFTRWFYLEDFSYVLVKAFYSDGTNETFRDCAKYSFNNPVSTLTAKFEPSKELSSLSIIFGLDPYDKCHITGSGTFELEYALNEAHSPNVDIQVSSEESGWLSKIWNGTVQGFNNVIDTISNLPSKIMEGITSLFIPDEETTSSYMDKFDKLLEEHFGAIYQVGDLIVDFVKNLVFGGTEREFIKLPKVDLYCVGIPFEFGGYDIRIVPQGFEFITHFTKMITSIVSAFLVFNTLRNKYMSIFGG